MADILSEGYNLDDLVRVNAFYGRIGKPLLDRIISTILFLLLSPIFIVTAILIKLSSPGPILYKQIRTGYKGQLFKILKFRSMIVQDDDPSRQALFNDPRITSVGRVIRRLKIDELPQLWHVMIGQMSLVGPRPTLPEQMSEYSPKQLIRYEVRPGLTGLAQVNGNTILSVHERREYDSYYVKKLSFGLDTKILCMTLSVVVFGEKLRG